MAVLNLKRLLAAVVLMAALCLPTVSAKADMPYPLQGSGKVGISPTSIELSVSDFAPLDLGSY